MEAYFKMVDEIQRKLDTLGEKWKEFEAIKPKYKDLSIIERVLYKINICFISCITRLVKAVNKQKIIK